ncbi:MAG: hypothetical protein NT122_01045 [Solirubrobacterales bacterium]|nr:hypothetical protein [Solirubrobacterales bacterium]
MRAEASLALLVALIGCSGVGMLVGIGIRPRARLAWAGVVGLGYLVGLGTLIVLAQLTIVLQIPFLTALALTTALGVIGAISAARQSPPKKQLRPAWDSLDRAGLVLLSVVVLLLLLLGSVAAWVHPLLDWDAWAIWTMKAVMINQSGGVPSEIFTNRWYSFMHPDYPIGIPALEAIYFRLAGSEETTHMHVLTWLILPAAGSGLALLADERLPAKVWGPIIAALIVVPTVVTQALTAYVDVPVALMLSAGLLAGANWLESKRLNSLIVCAALIAGAACMKNEGMTTGLLLFASLSLLGWRQWKQLALGWAIVLLAVVPWRLFLSLNSITGDLSPSRLIDTNYLSAHFGRATGGLTGLLSQAFSLQGQSPAQDLIVGAILVSAAAVVILSLPDRVAVFALLVILASLLAITSAYLVSYPVSLSGRIASSAPRVVLTPVMLLMLGAMLQLRRRSSPAQSISEQ